ncbi:MAG TPA: hypothetical protein VGM17_08630 [Rhizomicrobium sp.]
MVRSRAGLLSVDVYAVGSEEYVVEYKFRRKGRIFTGGIGLHDGIFDGNYAYTNETPPGQRDNGGFVELEFLGDIAIEDMYTKCHLMPTFEHTIWPDGVPPPKPARRKIDMSNPH